MTQLDTIRVIMAVVIVLLGGCTILIVYLFSDNAILKRQNKLANEWCADLRKAIRERQASEREPSQDAFQAGVQVGMQLAREDNDDDALDIMVDAACPCARCRAERWVVN